MGLRGGMGWEIRCAENQVQMQQVPRQMKTQMNYCKGAFNNLDYNLFQVWKGWGPIDESHEAWVASACFMEWPSDNIQLPYHKCFKIHH